MKKSLCIVIATLLVLALAGCATQATPATSGNDQKENARIADQGTNVTNTPPAAEANVTEPKATEPKVTEPKPTESARISAGEAKAAALTHAGVAEAAARDLEIDFEKERGTLYYEVSFESGGYEYEYLIDITNAQIVHFEKEVDR